jgi:hypothetical protein
MLFVMCTLMILEYARSRQQIAVLRGCQLAD